MLDYKKIKRKYKITDTNIADFFGYKNRISFFTSSMRDQIIKHIEFAYDQYTAGGVKGAADYIKDLSFLGSPERQQRYKDGLQEFIDTVNSQQRKGKYRDPERDPRSKGKTYKPYSHGK